MPYQNKSEQVIKKKTERDTLSLHLQMKRMKVSKAIQELNQFCQQHQGEDPLIYPVRENPFKDKRTCQIL
jgi:hypothetical protein